MAYSHSAFHTISQLTDFLLISSAYGASSPTHLQVRGITHVVNVTLSSQCPMPKYPKEIITTRIPVDDVPSAGLCNYFDRVADMIHDVKRKGGRVLVHCYAGRSRSATLCIVYLMKYDRMPLKQAYAYVKARRPLIRPNQGFWNQMISFEKELFGRTSVRMVNSRIGMIPDLYEAEYKDLVWWLRICRDVWVTHFDLTLTPLGILLLARNLPNPPKSISARLKTSPYLQNAPCIFVDLSYSALMACTSSPIWRGDQFFQQCWITKKKCPLGGFWWIWVG